MRFLILQDHLRRGGTEKQSLFAAQTLQNAGHHARILTFRPGGELEAAAKSPKLLLAPLQPFNSHIDEWTPALLSRISDFAPDLIMPMGKVANLKSLQIRKAFPSIPIINTLRTGKTLSHKLQECYSKATHIIVNSHDAATRLKNLQLDQAQIHVLYNACLCMPETLPEEPSPSPFHLISLAMLRPEKNHTALLDVVGQLPEEIPWKLTFAGSGSCLSQLRKKAERFALSDRVEFPGAISDIHSLLTSAHLCLSTSLCESLPNALVEAQAHGVPVVAYDANGVKETFLPGQSGTLIPPGETTAMSFAIEALLRDHKRRQTYRQAAHKYATSQFDPTQQAQHFLDIINDIATALPHSSK